MSCDDWWVDMVDGTPFWVHDNQEGRCITAFFVKNVKRDGKRHLYASMYGQPVRLDCLAPGSFGSADKRYAVYGRPMLCCIAQPPSAQPPSAQPPSATDTQDEIRAVCSELAEMLVEKNRQYGDSALSPQRVFSRADPVEQIRVRLDDKLSRLKSRQRDDDEDPEWDLMGYLVLLRIARRRRAAEKS